MTRPHLVVDPAVRFGAPNVKGISYHALAGHIAAGDNVDYLADMYDLARDDVLVACWYAGLYGTRGERAWLGAWATFAGKLMWGDHWDEIDDPPVKPKRAAK